MPTITVKNLPIELTEEEYENFLVQDSIKSYVNKVVEDHVTDAEYHNTFVLMETLMNETFKAVFAKYCSLYPDTGASLTKEEKAILSHKFDLEYNYLFSPDRFDDCCRNLIEGIFLEWMTDEISNITNDRVTVFKVGVAYKEYIEVPVKARNAEEALEIVMDADPSLMPQFSRGYGHWDIDKDSVEEIPDGDLGGFISSYLND